MFRLCLAVGVKHPDYLDLSGKQLRDWQEYFDGEGRADLRELAIAAMIAGDADVSPQWPYVEPIITAEEARDRVKELEAELCRLPPS